MDSKYVVYCHTNLINGKRYIGKSCNIPARWAGDGSSYIYKGHKERKTIFASAIKKYGWENFEHIILKEGLTNEEACFWESYYIELYKTDINKHGSVYGYNMTSGGEGAPGRVYSEASIAKMRMSHLGKKVSDETKRKIAEASRGRKLSNETKAKISRALSQKLKGRKLSPEHIENIRKASMLRGFPSWAQAMSAEKCRKSIKCVETGELFLSITDASNFYHLPYANLASVCQGLRQSVGGLHFVYAPEITQSDVDNSRLPASRRAEIISQCAMARKDELLEKCRKQSCKPVLCIDTGVIFSSGREIASVLGLNYKSVSDVCRGKAKSSRGYHLRFADDEDINSSKYTYYEVSTL